MSQYSWAEAKLTFKDNETLEMAVLPLRKGGWLQDNNQMLHDEGNDFAGEGIVCIEGNTLTLPSEQYLNLGRCIDEVIDMADSGFYYSNSDDGDLWISGWKNSEWQVAGDYKEIAKYLDDDKQKDYFLLDEDEFGEKYKTDDYWGERTDFFTEATENFIKRAWQYPKNNGDISNWDVSNASYTSDMFERCSIPEENKPKTKKAAPRANDNAVPQPVSKSFWDKIREFF